MGEAMTSFLADFERAIASFNGRAWLKDMKEESIGRFGALGFPTSKLEDWKYTNVSPIAQASFAAAERYDPAQLSSSVLDPLTFGDWDHHLAVFVNGFFCRELSRVGELPAGARVMSLAEALDSEREIVQAYLGRLADRANSAFCALNTSLFADGAFVFLPRGTALAKPLPLLFLSQANGTATATHPRNLIVAEENSAASIVESWTGSGDAAYFTNAVTEVFAGGGSVIDHYKLQREGSGAFHVATMQVRQERDSRFATSSLSLGAAFARNDINVDLAAEGAQTQMNGLYMVSGRQFVDHHTKIEHMKPNGTSLENYKGILGGKSQGVFSGKILVHKNAQKTDSRQNNKNLLLTRDAVVHTKPQLEIYADDVKCTHGATVGQLDEGAIFYMRSRGLDEAEARRMLIYAFAGDVIGRIRIEPIRRHLDETLLERLGREDLQEVRA